MAFLSLANEIIIQVVEYLEDQRDINSVSRIRACLAKRLEGLSQPLFGWRLEVPTVLRPTKQGYPLVSGLGNRF